MQSVLRRSGFTLTALVILAVLGPAAGCSVDNRLFEQALGRTPQVQIEQYLAALARGDRQAALALWSPLGTPNVTLEGRRESVTNDLLAYGPHLEHQLLEIEWWRTCCEPAVIEDASEAGGARVQVAISQGGRSQKVYTFDLLVPGGYWGAAAGNPIRQWAIVDIYPDGDAPLVWPRR